MPDEDPWKSLWNNHPTPCRIFLGIFVNILPHRCLMFARIPVQYSRVECVSNNLVQRCQIFLGIGRVFWLFLRISVESSWSYLSNIPWHLHRIFQARPWRISLSDIYHISLQGAVEDHWRYASNIRSWHIPGDVLPCCLRFHMTGQWGNIYFVVIKAVSRSWRSPLWTAPDSINSRQNSCSIAGIHGWRLGAKLTISGFHRRLSRARTPSSTNYLNIGLHCQFICRWRVVYRDRGRMYWTPGG